MRLQDHNEFTTLHWVKAELDDALAKARQALESYVEDPRDTYVMHTCAADLHQVHGTLRMVELYGAAMVVGEMEALVAALIDGDVAQRDEAYAALMRGMMQMPDYLERLQSGHRDVPVVLLPLLNDLRASRGEQLLHESVLFTPNLDAVLPTGAPGADDRAVTEAARGEIAELRVRFQQQLLAWFRGQGGERQLLGMRATLDSIAARCYSVPGRRLWWIAAGVLEGLERGVLRGHEKDVRQLIGRVDRSIRELLDRGEDALLGGDADDLARKLLYYVAQASSGSDRIDELRRTYRLDGLLPREAELEHARGSMSGHNRALLDTVSGAIKEDLLRVKEALDLFLRRSDSDPGQLGQQVDVLERVGDTLGMLALGVPRRVVGEQRRILGEIAAGVRAPDEESLLDVAGALLYVEASLDDHIDRLGAEGEALVGEGGSSPLPRSEARQILATLMREATANTSKVKDAIVAFVESSWSHGELEGTPDLMAEIGGALRMLGANRPAELADGIGLFIHRELLGDRRVPNSTQMDRLADALAALEYYLEAAREHRGGLEHILDVTQQSLAELGYWPVPSQEPVTELGAQALEDIESAAIEHIAVPSTSVDEGETVSSFADSFDLIDEPPTDEEVEAMAGAPSPVSSHPPEAPLVADAPEEDWVEVEEEVEQEVGGHGMAEFAGFQITIDGIDEEIREIFLEETQEEIDNLRAAFAQWEQEPEKLQALTPIRRSFHTLKGSGRLVGARLLGEFAWKVENMLNRVLEGSIAPHEGVQALVRHAIDALPELKAALEGAGAPEAPIAAIMETADRLAMGDNAFVEDVAKHSVHTVRTRVKRRVPRDTIAAVPVAAFASYGQVQAEEAVVSEPSFPEPALPPVDAVLLDILRTEVAQYLAVIRTNLAKAGDGELLIDDALLRAVHTLHGAIGMVDIPLLIQVLAPLEGLVKRVRASGHPLRRDGVQVLAEAADLVDHVMALFDTPQAPVPDVSSLASRIAALRDEQPEATVAHILYEPDPSLYDEDVSDVVAPEAQDDELTAQLADELAHRDEDLPPIDLPPLQPVVEEGDLTADFIASLGDDFAEDRPEGELKPILAYDPAQADEWYKLDTATSIAPLVGDSEVTPPENTEETAPAFVGADLVGDHDAPPPEDTEETTPAALVGADLVGDHGTSPPEDIDETEHSAPQESPTRSAPTESGVSPYADIDPDLLEVFVEEGREILDHADGALAAWRADPQQPDHVASLQRDLHTLKGSARMAGMAAVGDLAHAMETLLDAVAAGQRESDRAAIEATEGGFDRLHGMVQSIAQGRPIALADADIEPFARLAGAPIAPDTVTAESYRDERIAAMPPAPMRDLPDLLPEFEEEDLQRGSQEQIRVRADMLDTLVNHAGEVSIYRARLEQQTASFRTALTEHEQTVDRLRSQLRMLEIETEAQIIARYHQEHRDSGSSAFDPLELDRFSQLQQYSRALAESVSDLVSLQTILDDLTRQSENLLLQQQRVNAELQEGLMQTRMLPFDAMVPNLRRTLRQVAGDVGKRAQLVVEGANGEMDRNMLERIKAPFEHMLRNAVAHGIETPEAREAAGKSPEGTVRIQVAREATEIVVRLSDDGAGMDRDAIREKAVERGLLRADTRVSDEQLYRLIQVPGFSTAEKVTQVAGRGVGMDVVANEIKQLGGTLDIESHRGQGTTFVMRLPFTLAVTQALIVRIGETSFAIPMTSVHGVSQVEPNELAHRMADDEPVFEYAGEDHAIHDLPQLLGLHTISSSEEGEIPLLMVRAGDLRAAVRVDAVLGSREIVVKPVGPQVSSVPGILGATIMGDGSVLVILDLAPLVRHGVARRAFEAEAELPHAPRAQDEIRVKPLVMVVDDSITMRKVTGRVLERHGFEVMTAKDGVDALEKLNERVPDLMLLDIEMPRMDGYELATQMKAEDRLSGVPIVMITSRTGDKHRQRAFDIGVARYIGKPYQEGDLIVQINELLGGRHG
ncbi:Hpt domain-containing protein [Luteibacter anthropi]|uniref:Hpt domain-containing protein n=1 Tax=Luteibacter anthropi TaxID=564369 RepID=UPI0020324DFF|nr:Hpt domain-containing protein [Luteibacter anthropi]URX60995.1 Hpt domain-containing protein [Luteibacter anthropi]